MAIEQFKSIAPQLAQYTDEIFCHVLGDPLILKNLTDYLDILHQNNLSATLVTSGFPLQKTDASLFFHPAIKQVNVSMHSYSGNNPSISLETYLKPVWELCDSKRNFFVNLRLWIRDDEIFNQQIFERLNAHFKLTLHSDSREKFHQLAPYTRLHLDEQFEWPSLESEHNTQGYCHGLSAQIGILSDGTVVPCCLDKDGIVNLGNIFEEPLESVLDSQRAKNIYTGFRRKEAIESLCQKCNYKNKLYLNSQY